MFAHDLSPFIIVYVTPHNICEAAQHHCRERHIIVNRVVNGLGDRGVRALPDGGIPSLSNGMAEICSTLVPPASSRPRYAVDTPAPAFIQAMRFTDIAAWIAVNLPGLRTCAASPLATAPHAYQTGLHRRAGFGTAGDLAFVDTLHASLITSGICESPQTGLYVVELWHVVWAAGHQVRHPIQASA